MVVSMILLLVMTILALGASQATRMQDRMASSARNYELAFQSAEAGLRAGEGVVGATTLTSAPFPCTTGSCQVFELGTLTRVLNLTYEDQAFQTRAWWEARAQVYDHAAEMIDSADDHLSSRPPLYYIEEVQEVTDSLTVPPTGPPPSRMFYRVTAIGEGGNDTAQAVLQSTFARRFN